MAKIILITGANRGIGLEMVRQYSESGWKVIATCRNPQNAKELSSLSFSSLLKLDVTKNEDIENLSNQLKNESIDILMNNAGVEGPTNEELEAQKSTDWVNTFAVNTIAPYLLAKALNKQIEHSESKLIVNISSVYGSISQNKGKSDYFIYRASKAALNAASKCLANELQPQGIAVVSLHPGSVRTDMNPYGSISVTESVKNIKKTLSTLSQKDSGGFIDYLGNPISW